MEQEKASTILRWRLNKSGRKANKSWTTFPVVGTEPNCPSHQTNQHTFHNDFFQTTHVKAFLEQPKSFLPIFFLIINQATWQKPRWTLFVSFFYQVQKLHAWIQAICTFFFSPNLFLSIQLSKRSKNISTFSFPNMHACTTNEDFFSPKSKTWKLWFSCQQTRKGKIDGLSFDRTKLPCILFPKKTA